MLSWKNFVIWIYSITLQDYFHRKFSAPHRCKSHSNFSLNLLPVCVVQIPNNDLRLRNESSSAQAGGSGHTLRNNVAGKSNQHNIKLEGKKSSDTSTMASDKGKWIRVGGTWQAPYSSKCRNSMCVCLYVYVLFVLVSLGIFQLSYLLVY